MTPLLLALLACGADDSTDTDSGTTDTELIDTDVEPACAAAGVVTAEVLTLTTRDGVALEADRYAGQPGCPGIVLLHMIPPSNTRADWPDNFISKLTAHGWSVLALPLGLFDPSSSQPADIPLKTGACLLLFAGMVALFGSPPEREDTLSMNDEAP